MKMKKSNQLALFVGACLLTITSCKKTEDVVQYSSANSSIQLPNSTEALKKSDDPIAMHVDSILSGLIDSDLISTGYKYFDLNRDGTTDIAFEIISLQKLNKNSIPDTLDSLAACVKAINVEILDNSNWGYMDALNAKDKISEVGNWKKALTSDESEYNFILGTLAHGGQFEGKGERFLAFRMKAKSGNAYQYGWMKLICAEGNNALKIIDYAINNTEGHSILAGQKE
jgi:hypothetical protein